MRELERRARAFVQDMALLASAEFLKNTPKDSGKLANTISTAQQLSPYKWGVGSLEALGNIDEAAPKGTISAFLDWYRATRARENA